MYQNSILVLFQTPFEHNLMLGEKRKCRTFSGPKLVKERGKSQWKATVTCVLITFRKMINGYRNP